MKIAPPNYTQTPNDLFDHWLPLLGEAELKVLLVIIRKTFGWHKKRDRISITQLSEITGLLRETVIKATTSLQSKGIIIKDVKGQAGRQETHYELVIEEESNNSYPSVKPTPLVGLDPLGSTDPQKKAYLKETNQKKQQQASPTDAASAAASFGSSEKEKPKIYPCLELIDIPLYDKTEITERYDEPRVIKAIEWALRQKSYSKGLAAALKHACKHKIEYEEQKTKETPYETLCKHFKHGKLYNGAECCLRPQSISFSRGMKYQDMLLDKYFSWSKFKEMCDSFEIKFNGG